MKASFFFILVFFAGIMGGCGNSNTYLLAKKGEARPHQYNLVDLHDSTLEMLPDRGDESTSYLAKDVVTIPFDSVAYFRGPLRRSFGSRIVTGLLFGALSSIVVVPLETIVLFPKILDVHGPDPDKSYYYTWIATSVISSALVGYLIAYWLPEPLAEIDLHDSDHLEYMREHSIRAK